ncbi:hypothetical protein M107_0927 [Bacteroides fragilis str. 3725 D9(v)]|nr:hypothetical protein M107_0927 [Bacteroides fragilis str. 3725 D9(v)]EYA62680.1 hypothetical protein M070_0920 [Bacteroides fragilis str. A7 (UDC12-2)]
MIRTEAVRDTNGGFVPMKRRFYPALFVYRDKGERIRSVSR